MLKAQVIGFLGKDAVVNTLQNGATVINFNVAHTEKFKDAQGTQQEKTVWVECSYWTDKTAVAPYMKKGTQVYVEGQPEVKTFARQDGTTGASFALRVFSVQLLSSGNTQAVAATPAPVAAAIPAGPVPAEKLPF